MNAVVTKIETILKSSYDIKNYVDLVRELFPKVSMISPDEFRKEFSNFSSHIEGSVHIGNYRTADKKNIIILAVQLKNAGYVENSRSTQRSYAKKLIENANADAAFIAFYTEGEPKWRLSFVRLDYEIKIENGRLKTAESLTPAKRYSYLVGENEPCHTAISRFEKLIVDGMADDTEHPTLDDLENAFSVERVTDEFFKLYCEKFHQLREELEKNSDFCIEAEQHNYTSAQFAKKLMGQIVFLYFLQKKGWLGVGAWPSTLNEKEYNKAYYARGAKSRELIPIVYRPVGDGTYHISAAGLNRVSDEDEAVLAMCVKGKPWGSGPHDFMRKLFELAEKRNLNFFDDLLEPLFYDALNVNRGEQGYCPALHCRIPFLSGGLFEPIDGYDWEHNDFDIPNEVFSNVAVKGREADGILDIFDRYNFTMSEDEPMEREVAIDPEMLGKVFENLLEVKDRKSKGAFYTPREIVHYMCQESLINYLTNALQVAEEPIREFILYGDFMRAQDTEKTKWVQDNSGSWHMEFDFSRDLLISGELFSFKAHVNRLPELDGALANVRVADPAVGSGAFPLGMLNEIVRARQNISAYMAITMNTYDTRMMYQMERSTHNLKYETIKNCIFAADIDPSAVDIAQLRLWLSLVIDDEINPDAQNIFDGHKNPLPLPNLESNIVCGNSLIDEFEGTRLVMETDLFGDSEYQLDIQHSRFESVVSALIDKQNELFRCDNTERKKQLKDEIESLRDIVILSQLEGCTPDKIQRYQESKHMASKPYVLWQLDFARVFREKGGFDIVIGNPPYVDSEEMTKSMPEMRELYSKVFKCTKGNWDLYIPFWEKGFGLLNSNGNITFITPNKWLAIKYGAELRKHLFKHIYNVSDFSQFYAFESADVSTVVVMAKSISVKTIKAVKFDSSYEVTSNEIVEKALIEPFDNISLCLSNNFETLYKILKNKKLGDYFDISGAATVSETYEIAKIVEDVEDADPEEYFKFINTGIIDKFTSLWGKEIMTYVKEKYNYPVIKKNDLLIRFPRRYAQAIAPKLITTGIRYLEVYGDFTGEYLAAKSTEIITARRDLDIKTILPILNSTVVFYFIKEAYSGLAMGGGITFSPDNLSKIPLPQLCDDDIKQLNERAIRYSQYFDPSLQDELDEYIYKLYRLDHKDVEVLEHFKVASNRKRKK